MRGGVSSDATRTAAATPIDMGRDAAISAPPHSPPVSSKDSEDRSHRPRVAGPKTDPMPWLGGASSSASGVAMPGTPPVIDPLPASDVAPDTQRDEQLAVRAERRRWVMLAVGAAVIAAVAIGGYVAGRRERPAPPVVAAPTANATATTTATHERRPHGPHGGDAERGRALAAGGGDARGERACTADLGERRSARSASALARRAPKPRRTRRQRRPRP